MKLHFVGLTMLTTNREKSVSGVVLRTTRCFSPRNSLNRLVTQNEKRLFEDSQKLEV
jgi:hypothetical protein